MASVTKPMMLDETGKQIVDKLGNVVSSLNDLKKFELANGAGAHNSLYRGRDLTNVYTSSEICDMIASGDLSDLYVGDYFKKTISSTYAGSEDVDIQIAGFNCYMNVGETPVTRNHAVVVMKDCSKKKAQMHVTSTGDYVANDPANKTDGGYPATNMFTEVIPSFDNAFQAALGSSHVINRVKGVLLANAMNKDLIPAGITSSKGATTGWAWMDERSGLMTESELYGSPVFSSSGYDTGEACIQLPLFALNPAARIAGLGRGGSIMWYWLRNVATSTHFCGCSYYGDASYNSASYASGVRLRFLIG